MATPVKPRRSARSAFLAGVIMLTVSTVWSIKVINKIAASEQINPAVLISSLYIPQMLFLGALFAIAYAV
jgi:hypothetical protein